MTIVFFSYRDDVTGNAISNGSNRRMSSWNDIVYWMMNGKNKNELVSETI